MVGGCGVATGERNKVFFAIIGIEERVIVGLVVEADGMRLLGRHMGGLWEADWILVERWFGDHKSSLGRGRSQLQAW